MENHHRILRVRISLGYKPQLKLTILGFFGPNLPKKNIFGGKQKKSPSLLNCAYSNQCRYLISGQTDNFDYLYQICPEKGIFGRKWEK